MKTNPLSAKYVKNRRRIIMVICVLMALLVLTAFYHSSETLIASKDAAKQYILANHTAETSAENAVTAVYLNYRMWDTIFESMLLMLSAIAVISFSWRKEHE